ncbi:15292_t:CDS:2, partial [Racocetra fulgida]
CRPVGAIRPNESVFRIIDVEFHSLTNSTRYSVSAYPGNRSYYDDNSFNDQLPQQSYEHPCAQLRKLLSNGHFYFSSDFDLTKSLNVRSTISSADKYTYDEHFLWNKFMIGELLNFRSKLDKLKQLEMDNCGFLVLAIQGYVGMEDTIIGSSSVSLSLISKLSCKRADDDGNVANFVEGLQMMAHKIQISRGPAATQPAVERHFNELQSRYGNVHIVNLLGVKEGEYALSKEYKARIIDLNGNGLENRVLLTDFDFNSICKTGNYENMVHLFSMIGDKIEEFAFFALDMESNCPIFYQKDISQFDIESLYSRHSTLWAENGDSLSKIYTGTGALRSEYTRSGKVTWA